MSTSEDEHEDTTEDGIPVSATQGDGVDVLWDRIQEKVLQATSNKHIVFTVPTDGPQINKVGANLHFTKSHIKYLRLFKLVQFFLSSWLHQNATVTTVESTNENTLQVSAVISMTNFACTMLNFTITHLKYMFVFMNICNEF